MRVPEVVLKHLTALVQDLGKLPDPPRLKRDPTEEDEEPAGPEPDGAGADASANGEPTREDGGGISSEIPSPSVVRADSEDGGNAENAELA